MYAMGTNPIGNAFAYELQLFDRFCASQRVTKIGRTIRLVLDAVSQMKMECVILIPYTHLIFTIPVFQIIVLSGIF